MGPSLPGLEVCLTWPQAKVVVRFRAQPQPQRGPAEATRAWRPLSPRHSPKAWQEPPGMHLSPHKRERRQCQKRGPGQGFYKSAHKRLRRRVTAERFSLALKLVSPLTARPGQLLAQWTPNAKEASEPEKTSLPENPRPRGLVPVTRRERGVPRARLCRSLRGTWKPAFGGQGGKPPAGESRGHGQLSPGRSAWGLGSTRREGRQAGCIPAPGAPFSLRALPPVLVPSIPRGRGPPPEPGTRSPCDLGWAWASPRTPWRKQSAGRRRRARRRCRGYLGMVPGGSGRSARRGTGAARTPGRAGRWG